VPWGLDEVLGELVGIYETGLGPRAVVRLLSHDDPEATVTVPADALREPGRASSRPSLDDARTFERHLLRALHRIANALHAEFSESAPDSRFDAILRRRSLRVVVEAKFFPEDVLVGSDTISGLAGYAGTSRRVLLVTNQLLTEAAHKRLRELQRRRTQIWHSRWRGPQDDKELIATISSALARNEPH
jgi:hypothetical protein